MSENEIKPVLTIDANTLEMAKAEALRAERVATRPYSRLRVEMGEVALYDQSAIDRLTADRDSWAGQAADRLQDWDEMRIRCEKAEADRDEAQRKLSVAVADGKELVADAERYRFLRNAPTEIPAAGVEVAIWDDGEGEAIRGAELDAAIDAARAEGGV